MQVISFRTHADRVASEEGRMATLRAQARYIPETRVFLFTMPHPYEVDVAQIRTKAHLIGWIAHLLEKSWMTPLVLGHFILEVCRIKGWTAVTPF